MQTPFVLITVFIPFRFATATVLHIAQGFPTLSSPIVIYCSRVTISQLFKWSSTIVILIKILKFTVDIDFSSLVNCDLVIHARTSNARDTSTRRFNMRQYETIWNVNILITNTLVLCYNRKMYIYITGLSRYRDKIHFHQNDFSSRYEF